MAYKSLLVWMCCTSVLFSQDTIDGVRVPLVGDETPLVKIKTEPQKYITALNGPAAPKILYFTGGIKASDYFNYGYREQQLNYYSLRFSELVSPTKTGDDAYLYLRRDEGKQIVDRIIERTRAIESTNSNVRNGMVIIRVKAVLRSDKFDDVTDLSHAWNMFELVDAQFMEKDKWGPWLISAQRKAKAEKEASEKEAADKAQRQMEAEKKIAAAREAELQRQARTRTWQDKNGKYSITAEYRGMGQGFVSLRKADGKDIKVSIDALSDADRKWLDDVKRGRAGKAKTPSSVEPAGKH